MGRYVGTTAGIASPIKTEGSRINGTIDYQKIIRTVPAYSFWTRIVASNVPGKFVPLFPFARIASSGSTTELYTCDLAIEAAWFNPADADVNKYWLTANDGAQEATYWDSSADATRGDRTISGAGGGAIYSESTAVASVSDVEITIAALSAAAADNDVVLPGGIDNSTNLWDTLYILPEEITVEEINRMGADFQAIRGFLGAGTVVDYSKLPYDMKILISYGVIPEVGVRNITIDGRA